MSNIDEILSQVIQMSAEQLAEEKPQQQQQQQEEANEKGFPLPGERTAHVPLGTVMVCSQNPSHPRPRWSQKGQSCRICGALLVPLASSSGAGGGTP